MAKSELDRLDNGNFQIVIEGKCFRERQFPHRSISGKSTSIRRSKEWGLSVPCCELISGRYRQKTIFQPGLSGSQDSFCAGL